MSLALKTYKKYIILLGAVVFCGELSLSPLLHNHVLDFANHDECPVTLLSSNNNTGSVEVFEDIRILVPEFELRYCKELVIDFYSSDVHLYFNKAPPSA